MISTFFRGYDITGTSSTVTAASASLCHPFADRGLRLVQRLANDVDQGRFAGLDRLLQDAAQLSRVLDPPALDPEGGRHRGVVGTAEIDREIALVEPDLLPGLDPAERRIRDDQHRDRQLEPGDRLQLAAGEAEAAVAHHRDRLARWAADSGAGRRAHRLAERAMPAVRPQV